MTKHEFIDYAIERHPLNKKTCQIGIKPYERQTLEADICTEYSGKFNANKVLDFFEGIGRIYFERTERNSGDALTIDIRWLAYIYYWKDIDAVVNRIGYIENCAGVIKTLYLSEYGLFYDQDHDLLATNEEQFFDYLTTVEFDYHPVIAERTYEMLRCFGWYEGRRVDTTDFEYEMRQRSIELTEKQLAFLSEFSGLSFNFDDYYLCWRFYSLNEIWQDCSPQLRTGYKETVYGDNGEIVALKSLNCGDSYDGMYPISVDSEGRLLRGTRALGRNAIESINHLANYVNENVEWLQINNDPKMI